MNSQLDRFRLLVEIEGIKMPWLEKETGIERKRWSNVKAGVVKISGEEIEKLGAIYPEYKMWLAYGDENPEYGQISPMTKRAQRASGQ